MNNSQTQSPILIDTDMGPDDWLAILFLILSESVQIRGITVSGTGEVHGPQGVRNIHRLFTLLHSPAPSISFGSPLPIEGTRHFPELLRTIMDSMMSIELPIPPAPIIPADNACAQMAQQLTEAKSPLDLLAVGPLTNLAELLAEDPTLKEKISRIYVMGGAIRVEGNIREILPQSDNLTAEWNMYCDPRAASIVFTSRIPIILVPLDTTNTTFVDDAFLAALKDLPNSPAATFAHTVLSMFKSHTESGRYYLWDVCAAALMMDRSIGTYESLTIRVNEEDPNAGQLLIDPDHGVPITVCTQMDVNRFRSMVLETFALSKSF